MKEHSKEWCDEMKKTCEYCQHTNWFCTEHELWNENKSARVWGGMHHQQSCTFLQKLNSKDKSIVSSAINRYCAIILTDWALPNFDPNNLVCPDCEGWDIKITKDFY